MHKNLVGLIVRIYDGSKLAFELENETTEWCKTVKVTMELSMDVPCRLSSLTHMSSKCVHGAKYAVVGQDGVMEWKSQTGIIYTYDVCLIASSEDDMKVIMEQVNECVIEYGIVVF